MKRITVSMSDGLAAALKLEADRLGVSAQEVARRAIATHLPRTALGASGYRTTAKGREDILAKEWTGDLIADSFTHPPAHS